VSLLSASDLLKLTEGFFRVDSNKRISRHRLRGAYSLPGNLRGLLERGVQELMDSEEVFDKTLEVAIGYHWGQGYLDFSGNMLSTLQALRHFAQHLPSRNILFTFGM
jgi:hypothetical protein